MRVVWTREATNDLENVLAYIAARNPAAAATVAERIDRAVEDIAFFPRAARLDHETGCREAVVRGCPCASSTL
jgi:plasmid stabilization system protein ParE